MNDAIGVAGCLLIFGWGLYALLRPDVAIRSVDPGLERNPSVLQFVRGVGVSVAIIALYALIVVIYHAR
jgi:hypothetical protein